MHIHTILNCMLILAGTVIMSISITAAKGLMKTLPFVAKHHRKKIRRYLSLHRGLMLFFLIGYVAVMTAFALRYALVSETFVSIIFLLGAIFVFSGVAIQSRLLAEVQFTLQEIIPICAKCKRIRTAEGNPKDPKNWKEIEVYIAERNDVAFSHGYCPQCAADEIMNLEMMQVKT